MTIRLLPEDEENQAMLAIAIATLRPGDILDYPNRSHLCCRCEQPMIEKPTELIGLYESPVIYTCMECR